MFMMSKQQGAISRLLNVLQKMLYMPVGLKCGHKVGTCISWQGTCHSACCPYDCATLPWLVVILTAALAASLCQCTVSTTWCMQFCLPCALRNAGNPDHRGDPRRLLAKVSKHQTCPECLKPGAYQEAAYLQQLALLMKKRSGASRPASVP